MSSNNNFDFLKNFNKDGRDAYIEFFEQGHVYKITLPERNEKEVYKITLPERNEKEAPYTSVTTFIHRHFPPFESDKIIAKIFQSKNFQEGHKYWGLSAEEIKEQWSNNAKLGTELHARIENFMNEHSFTSFSEKFKNPGRCQIIGPMFNHAELLQQYLLKQTKEEPIEWNYFLQFVKDTPHLVPYRTEWLIFHEDIHIAGSIDMVYQNTETGKLAIYDWKRCLDIKPENPFNQYAHAECIPHIPDTNYWHYALQLNLYKRILEDKYSVEVSEMVLIRLHPTANSYERIEVPDLQLEIEQMIQEKKKIK